MQLRVVPEWITDRWLQLTIIVLFLLLISWISRMLWLPLVLKFLDLSSEPHSADFAVILGAGEHRTRTAIELFENGTVSRVMICGYFPDRLQPQIDLLWEAGLSESDVVINIGGANTWQEAIRVLDVLKKENASTAIVVTDAYHMRRASATYRKLLQDNNIELTFVAATVDISSDNWWQVENYRNAVIKEYFKLVYYWLRYGIWPL